MNRWTCGQRWYASKLRNAACLVLLVMAVSGGWARGAEPAADERMTINFLQINDVYEIAPLHRGAVGGLARVATIRKELLRENPHTYTILAGDFFSPSALGTAKVDGKPLAGRQMVDVLKVMGLDYVTFGNHEFDLKEEQFRERLKELDGKWVSSNVLDAAGRPFEGVPRHLVLEVKDGQHPDKKVRIGLIGVTIDINKAPYVRYGDPVAAAKAEVEQLQDVDLIIALTHLTLAEDQKVAREVPRIDLIMGGHEHENMNSQLMNRGRPGDGRGQGGERMLPPICKADANARTVYVHQLTYNTSKHKLEKIDSHLELVTVEVPEDPQTAAAAKHWVDRAYQGFRAQGFEPDQKVADIQEDLEGREAVIRHRSTNLTELIGDAMIQALGRDGADLPRFSVFNSGSIRVDDVIHPGVLTQYDVLRILPFGGDIWSVTMDGETVQRLLTEAAREAHQGKGSHLQFRNAHSEMRDQCRFFYVGEKMVDANGHYQVAINDFLWNGRESGFAFLKEVRPRGRSVADMRKAVIEYLQKRDAGKAGQSTAPSARNP